MNVSFGTSEKDFQADAGLKITHRERKLRAKAAV
jgi:hypothetical protein